MKIYMFVLLCGAMSVFGELQWPVEISTNGISIKIYQPQPIELNQNVLSAHSALSVIVLGVAPPVYGVAHFRALVIDDATNAVVLLRDVLVVGLELGSLANEDRHRINAWLVNEAAGWTLEIPAEEFRATLAMAAESKSLPEAPKVAYEGEPHFIEIAQSAARYADNANRRIVHHGARYYCIDRGNWFTADHPEGAWKHADRIPDEVRCIPARLGWAIDYESKEYSINVDPQSGYFRFRDRSGDTPKKNGKKWDRNASKFPE